MMAVVPVAVVPLVPLVDVVTVLVSIAVVRTRVTAEQNVVDAA